MAVKQLHDVTDQFRAQFTKARRGVSCGGQRRPGAAAVKRLYVVRLCSKGAGAPRIGFFSKNLLSCGAVVVQEIAMMQYVSRDGEA